MIRKKSTHKIKINCYLIITDKNLYYVNYKINFFSIGTIHASIRL